MLHVGIVAPELIPVPPVVAGSVEICVSAIADHLAKKHQVTVFSRRHRKLEPVTQNGNLTIVRVMQDGSGDYLHEVKNAMRGYNFDVIQVDNRPAYAARIKRRYPQTPVALFLHSLTFVTPPQLSLSAAERYLDKVDLIIANSSSLRGELIARFPLQQDKIRVVQLGVDTDTFRLPSPEEKRINRKQHGLENTYNVMFVGRLVPRKGMSVLIRAVRELRRDVPNAQLIVAGGSPHKAYIRRMKRYAEKLRVPVMFLGYVPHRELHQKYWLGDCFVCPSQKHEAFGLVNVEAMASGVPVIASKIGGIQEIVNHGRNGLLVRHYRNYLRFAEYMRRVASQPDYAANLAEAAREAVVERFGWEKSAERLETVYSEVCTKCDKEQCEVVPVGQICEEQMAQNESDTQA